MQNQRDKLHVYFSGVEPSWFSVGPFCAGLLAKVLEKTLLYCQEEGSQTNTNAADLLLSLSLEAHITDARVRMELSRAIHILSGGWAGHIQDLLTGWLQEALFKFCPPLERPALFPFS